MLLLIKIVSLHKFRLHSHVQVISYAMFFAWHLKYPYSFFRSYFYFLDFWIVGLGVSVCSKAISVFISVTAYCNLTLFVLYGIVLESVKKVMLTFFWDMQKPITTNFLERAETLNNGFFWLFIRQNSPCKIRVIQ